VSEVFTARDTISSILRPMSAPPANATPSGSGSTSVEPPATFERRPWGTFHVLDESDTFKVKRISVDAGQRLSYQLHHRRAEHWVVVAGEARVTLDDLVYRLRPGQSIDIPRGSRHRIENPAEPGGGALTFVEVQQGDYFGEDDIVRLDDDYGRSA
jgi:mannose-6-phosphate isomerase-like protein (cupin superfamily)